jgi:hypothetical protein
MGYLLSPMTRIGRSTSRRFFGRRKFSRRWFRSRSQWPAPAARPLSHWLDLSAGEVRRAVDGWHAVLRIGAVDHRIWSKDAPVLGASYAAELPFDCDFDARAYAARRLANASRSLSGRHQFLPHCTQHSGKFIS